MGYHGWGWMPFGGALFWLLAIIVIVAIASMFRRPRISQRYAGEAGRSRGLDLLEERYAKGEIQRDEYLQKKRDLGG
jgi:putative membrane protein